MDSINVLNTKFTSQKPIIPSNINAATQSDIIAKPSQDSVQVNKMSQRLSQGNVNEKREVQQSEISEKELAQAVKDNQVQEHFKLAQSSNITLEFVASLLERNPYTQKQTNE